MGESLGKYRTFAVAPAKLIEPDDRAIAAIEKSSSEFDDHVLNQDDLLAIESVLVTTGINSNDDVFLIDQTWAARKSPPFKPMNWMHQDSDIIGVMYHSYAVDLEGNPLSATEYPDKPFEIIVKGAVYKYTFPKRVEEIERLHADGKLFVSMEAWFDDYDYALVSDNQIESVIERKSDTAFLDRHLKVKGGDGKYVHNGVEYRIGRALKNIVFGGIGFVLKPANSRSHILNIDSKGNVIQNKDEIIEGIIRYLNENISIDETGGFVPSRCPGESRTVRGKNRVINKTDQEEKSMSDKVKAEDQPLTENSVRRILAEDRKAVLAEKEQEGLRAKADKAASQVKELEATKAELENENSSLKNKLSSLESAFSDLFKEVSKEAKALDESAFKFEGANESVEQKVEFLKNTTRQLAAKAATAGDYEKKLAEATALARSAEVESLLGDFVTAEELEFFQDKVSRLSEDAYQEWILDKRILVQANIPMNSDNKKEKKENGPDKKKKDKDKKNEAGESFHQSDFGFDGGRMPNPGSLRNPRHKIAGSEEDAETVLDNAEPESGNPNLTGANAGSSSEESDDPTGMRSLAEKMFSELHPEDEREKARAKAIASTLQDKQ